MVGESFMGERKGKRVFKEGETGAELVELRLVTETSSMPSGAEVKGDGEFM